MENSPHPARIVEVKLGPQIPRPLLGPLLDVIGGGLAVEHDAVRPQLDAEVLDPSPRPLTHAIRQFLLQPDRVSRFLHTTTSRSIPGRISLPRGGQARKVFYRRLATIRGV